MKEKKTPKSDLAGPSALELTLRSELEQLERELAVAKQEALEAKQKNDWLQEEVRRVEEETREYEAYMTRKTAQEQERIKTIAEFNKQEMDGIAEEKRRRMLDYERQRQDLQDNILQFSAELERCKKQLSDLASLQAKRDAQLKEIADLEAAMEQARVDHAATMQSLKAQCFVDKMEFQRSSFDTYHQIQTSAKQEAVGCLDQQSTVVREENGQLRRDLLSVLARNKDLRTREEILRKQNRDLSHQVELMSRISRPRRVTSQY